MPESLVCSMQLYDTERTRKCLSDRRLILRPTPGSAAASSALRRALSTWSTC